MRRNRHPDTAKAAGGVTAPSPRGFRLLLGIGAIDNAARSGFLTFLPFLLQAKGASLTTIALALSLVLAGGAAGKLVCGYLGARLGVLTTVLLTEGSTAAGMVALLALPLDVVLIVLPLVGIALNGTSSVLYGTVPELVPPEACARAFGIFYTGTIAASALAPPLLGLFADRLGVSNAIVGIAARRAADDPARRCAQSAAAARALSRWLERGALRWTDLAPAPIKRPPRSPRARRQMPR